MGANDGSAYTQKQQDEKYDALIIAATGEHSSAPVLQEHDKVVTTAVIDEEQWLLDAIQARGSDECRSTTNVCPPTFLQAIGERDYDNPLTSLSNGSRTQLWKPSRSWWEAKSGKNPWIEPKSHNKRWRYASDALVVRWSRVGLGLTLFLLPLQQVPMAPHSLP